MSRVIHNEMNHAIHYEIQFDRNEIHSKINTFLNAFDKNETDIKVLHLNGKEGCGKTTYIKQFLKTENKDMIYISQIDTLTKDLLENIMKNQISNACILSSFQKPKKKIVVIDNLYEMYKSDKNFISGILKQLKPRKKRICKIPFICISSFTRDLKFNELKKNSCIVQMPDLTSVQVKHYINTFDVYKNNECIPLTLLNQTNFHTLNNQIKNAGQRCDTDNQVTHLNTHRDIFLYLMSNCITIKDHDHYINDTDRTSVSLLFHENICDVIDFMYKNDTDKDNKMKLYSHLLKRITFSDYLDRTTFQKQVWILNDITSIIRNISNSQLLHKISNNSVKHNIQYNDIRFTKVLTKYSTEYNNKLFLNTVAQKLFIHYNDVIPYFISIRDIQEDLDNLILSDISKLDITRMYKYIDAKHNILTSYSI